MAIKITPVNEQLEVDGEWANYRGVKLLIARNNNVNFKRIFKKLTKPYKMAIENDTMREEDSIDILSEAMADSILLDWNNFPGDIEYSKENAKELLINDPDCLQFIQEFSNNLSNYLLADRQELAGK